MKKIHEYFAIFSRATLKCCSEEPVHDSNISNERIKEGSDERKAH